MDIEIKETPVELKLYGLGGTVENNEFAEVGQGLMKQLGEKIDEGKLSPKSVPYWVYDSMTTVYAGFEFENEDSARGLLEHKPVKLEKYVYHRYVGPFDGLGGVHRGLEEEMSAQGLTEIGPRVEKYSSMSGDPSEFVTELYVGVA